MPNQFEGNLAKKPENDIQSDQEESLLEGDRGSSGIRVKDKSLAELKEFDPAEATGEEGDDHVELSEDDLEVDDGFETLKDEDLVVDHVEEAKKREKIASDEHAQNIEYMNSAEGRKAIRESMKGELDAVRKEYEASDAEVEKSKDGKIVGLKNVPMVSWNSFRQAMAGRMEAIKNETIHLLGVLRDNVDNHRLKALEQESNAWIKMYRDGKKMEDAGVDAKDIHIDNKLYQQVETIPAEGVSKVQAETIASRSIAELNGALARLDETEPRIDSLLDVSKGALKSLEAVGSTKEDFEKQAKDKTAYADFLRGMEDYQTQRRKEVLSELQDLDKPENLDLCSKRLNVLKRAAEERVGMVQSAMKKTKEKESIAFGSEAIDYLEEKIVEYQKDLLDWKNSPIREMAMQVRHEDLQNEMAKRKMQLEIDEPMELKYGVPEEVHRVAKELTATAHEKPKQLIELRERVFGLLREKARIVSERTAIMQEVFNRDLQLSEDVDLTELNKWAQEPEIDVDTSDFDAEPVEEISAVKEKPKKKAKKAA